MRLFVLIFLALAVAFPVQGQSGVDNVTLELELDAENTVYVGGEDSGGTGSRATQVFEQPFLSDTDPVSLIGAPNPIELEYIQGDPDTFRVVQEEGSFLIANSRGGVESISNRVEEVGDGFLNRIDPSFGFEFSSTPTVKIIYEFPYPVTRVTGNGGNVDEIGVRNRISVDNSTELWVRLE